MKSLHVSLLPLSEERANGAYVVYLHKYMIILCVIIHILKIKTIYFIYESVTKNSDVDTATHTIHFLRFGFAHHLLPSHHFGYEH